ncbi:MAG: carbon-nitrogen hydrolase family protein [Aristaeellaceae bacterium]
MRSVRIGAIQPSVPPMPEACSCLSPAFVRDETYLMDTWVTPQLRTTLDLLERAGQAGLHAVTTSEDVCVLSHYLIDTAPGHLFRSLAARSCEQAEAAFSQLARRYGMYIIACYFKPCGDQVFNVASIFDPRGIIVGEYRKTHLPPNELWQVTPGNDVPVFDLDFGRVGVEICYDMMFPALSEALSLKGASFVFHPTGGYGWYDAIGEATLRTRANDNSIYLITAKNHCGMGAGKSSVIDYWGQVLADAGFYANTIVWQDVDPDVPKAQPDWFYQTGMSGQPLMRPRHEQERRPDLYHALCEPVQSPQQPPDAARQEELREKIRKGLLHW